MLNLRDTIAAVATGSAPAGIAIVRLSGPNALAFARKLAPSLRNPLPARRMELSQIQHPATGEALDQGLVVHFPAPHSFTGEDVVEIHGHGGTRQAAQLLSAALAAGARAAEPGEFTRRAVLNGRLSLERAEALADLVSAQTEAGLAAARSQLFGALGQAIESLASQALSLQAEVEAALDFPDDTGATPPGIAERSLELSARCQELLRTHRWGRSLREGVRLVLAGAPNAGKSSLMNILLGEARALVDDEPGTTRDSVEAPFELAGIPTTLVDTAGLREGAGKVEQLGIERTRAEIARGSLILWVMDATAPVPRPPDIAGEVVEIFNKADLIDVGVQPGLRISARTGQGVDHLKVELARRLGADHSPANGELVLTNRRHAELIAQAATAFEQAGQPMKPLEIIGYDLREGLAALDRIRGKGVDDALLDEIFARFCIGK